MRSIIDKTILTMEFAVVGIYLASFSTAAVAAVTMGYALDTVKSLSSFRKRVVRWPTRR
jgi:hypothetical protein